jgi:hypothetical protein
MHQNLSSLNSKFHYNSTKKNYLHWRRRVPCQARGLSKDHNASTAFIEIPDNAPHGLQLVCSHAECANSQRRFRYCRGKINSRISGKIKKFMLIVMIRFTSLWNTGCKTKLLSTTWTWIRHLIEKSKEAKKW